MAAKSTLKNMVVCLTLTCLLCSSILGVVYAITLDPIAAASEKSLKEALSMVLPQGGEISTEPRTVEVDGIEYEYYSCTVDGEPSSWAVKSTVNGFGGPLTVLVGVEKNGTVHATKVLSHSETPGLGAKCQTDEHFIGQFEGFDPSSRKLAVTKDGGDVDAITASTITSRAYTLAVANAVAAVISGIAKSPEGGLSLKTAPSGDLAIPTESNSLESNPVSVKDTPSADTALPAGGNKAEGEGSEIISGGQGNE